MTDFVLPSVLSVLRTDRSVLVLPKSSLNEIKGLQRSRTEASVLFVSPQKCRNHKDFQRVECSGGLIMKPPYYVWDGHPSGVASHPPRSSRAGAGRPNIARTAGDRQ